jgi:serine protease AprX
VRVGRRSDNSQLILIESLGDRVNKKGFFVTSALVLASILSAQERGGKYWIYFRDKAASVHSLLKTQDVTAVALSNGLSGRALARRAKVLSVNKLFTDEDLPVSDDYMRQLRERGISIENRSRWFNAVTAYLSPDQLTAVQRLSFVDKAEPVRTFKRKDLPLSESLLLKYTSPSIDSLHSYGPSYNQLKQINVIDVHNLRITGRGILVGMLDTGFRWRTHEAMKNMQVINEYDFIQKDNVTANESGKNPVDNTNQDAHGTLTMSVAGGYKEGVLVSPAFGASFILAKTEYVPTETNVEEDNWVAGIEWEESYGVDVVSSSLSYNEFDAGQKSYTYQDMNGRTATTTKAAVLAMRRGVVVVSANGNEGLSSWHYLTSPADADSIISVGAVNEAGKIAGFSSVGPTSDSRIKPDVVAQGVSTFPGNVSFNTSRCRFRCTRSFGTSGIDTGSGS